MIKSLTLKNVGAMPEKTITFGKRLNIITGDNGLGKSFLLDIIWYALTRCWPIEVNGKLMSGYMGRPMFPAKEASIDIEVNGQKNSTRKLHSEFKRDMQKWSFKDNMSIPVGLVVYAHYDGSFSIWDPERNYWPHSPNETMKNRQPAFIFTSSEVWEGRTIPDIVTGKDKWLCNGLIRDWVSWQDRQDNAFKILSDILEKLSPPDFKDKISPDKHKSVSVDDSREHPFIKMPYGSIPAIWASAGIRRILSLAYMLTWTLTEHLRACEIMGQTPSKRMTFLFDEVDSHLHPKWQRQIMNGIMEVLEGFSNVAKGEEYSQSYLFGHFTESVQIICVTHSPLVMASLESIFDSKYDKWLDMDADENGQICIEERDFTHLGTAEDWLTSEAFDLTSTASLEIENAKKEYNQLIATGSYTPQQLKSILKKLERCLPDTDPFWLIVDYP